MVRRTGSADLRSYSFSSTGKPEAKMNEELDCRLSPEVLSFVRKAPATNVPTQGNLLRSHDERFKTLPEDVRAIQTCETCWLHEKDFSWTFVTIHDFVICFGGGVGACRSHTLPRDDEDAVPLRWIRGHPNIGPVLEVKVTYPLYPYGIELRFESLKKDGSQSWIVICRGRNKIR